MSKRAPKRKFHVVQVVYEDPQLYSGWHDGPEADKAEPALCVAAGYMIRDDKDVVSVAVTLGVERDSREPNQANGIFNIPRGCVKQVDVLLPAQRRLRKKTERDRTTDQQPS